MNPPASHDDQQDDVFKPDAAVGGKRLQVQWMDIPGFCSATSTPLAASQRMMSSSKPDAAVGGMKLLGPFTDMLLFRN